MERQQARDKAPLAVRPRTGDRVTVARRVHDTARPIPGGGDVGSVTGVTQDLNTSELDVLARYLETYRRVMRWKLDGVDEAAAREPLVPSGTSLLGLVKHLAYVERYWFQRIIGGIDVPIPWLEGDDDADWRLDDDEDAAAVLAAYEREAEESRRILSDVTDPDATVEAEGEQVSVRRILVHMVEETARHAGHADILRELIDGATGDFPEPG
jgi:uncharacterized damage-inducible protein DinB